MEDQQQPKKSFPPTFGLLLLLILVILAGFLYTRRANLTSKPVETQVTTEPTKVPTALTLSAESTSVTLGQPVTLTVTADSNNQDIVGFDILVGYDSGAFTLQAAQSSDKNFRVFQKNMDTHVSVTGIKNAQVSEETAFTNEPLLTITFVPKKSGSYKFSLQPSVGKESTKLVNAQTQVLVPSVQEVSLEVK